MKTRPLFLLLPLLALTAGYFAWDTGFVSDSNNNSQTKSPDPVSLAAAANPNFAPPPAKIESPTVAFDSSAIDGCETGASYNSNGDGTVTALIDCGPTKPEEKHPYELYSSAALDSLAYSDAKAAEVLGMRLRDNDLAQSMSLMLRASALSGGDTAPIVQTLNMYPHSHEIDGKPVVKTIRTKFVLAAVVDLLSGESVHVVEWEEKVRRYSSDPEAEIALLYKQAWRIIEEMRQIETDVTGSATIGGQGDA